MQLQKKIRRETGGLLDLVPTSAMPVLAMRRVTVRGREHRLCLETAVWDGLDAIALNELRSTQELCAEIEAGRPRNVPLTSAIRTYVLDYFRRSASTPPQPPYLLS